MTRKLLIAACILAVLGCLVFALIKQRHYHPEYTVPSNNPYEIDVRADEEASIDQLRTAPWQGLRFLSDEREWRFYGVAGKNAR